MNRSKIRGGSARGRMGYVGDDGINYSLKNNTQIFDDGYTWSNVGRLFYSPKNIEYLQDTFRRIMITKYGVNPGRQNKYLLMERMHEAYYFVADTHYRQTIVRNGINVGRAALAGWRYEPANDEERGVMPTGFTEVRNNAPAKLESYSMAGILKKLNSITLKDLVKIAREKVLTVLNYHKEYNKTIADKIKYTGFTRQPEPDYFQADRMPAMKNPTRVKPRMFKDSIFDLYAPRPGLR